jgi:hypothetical protein
MEARYWSDDPLVRVGADAFVRPATLSEAKGSVGAFWVNQNHCS